MVDEDFVMGYVVGYNDGTGTGSGVIVEKTITKNGTYHAADDNADGFDPINVNVPKMTKEELDKLIEWIIEQIMPQLPDDTPKPDIPEIDVGDLRPSIDGYDWPYLTAVSPDGRTTQIMYGIVKQTEYGPSKFYYVDTFVDGLLVSHEGKLEVSNYGQIPGATAQMNSDSTVTVTSRWEDGTTQSSVWGPYIGWADGKMYWSI